MPFVSIVIPHRGKDADLEVCIKAIRNQTYPRQSMETLIVLNESLERPLNFDLIDGEILLWQPIEGSYAARNLGIEQSRGSVIALTDSDTQPSPNWISEGINCLNGKAQLVAGAIEVTHSIAPSASALYEKLYAFDQEKNAGFGQSVTANLIVKSEVFKLYGLFDQAAKSGEDFEWTRSVTSRGAVLTYCEKAIIKHPAREDLRGLITKAFRTTWYFPKGSTGTQTSLRILRRAKQKLLFGPSKSRSLTMPISQRFVAHMVRLGLISFMTLLLIARAVKGIWIRAIQMFPIRSLSRDSRNHV